MKEPGDEGEDADIVVVGGRAALFKSRRLLSLV